MGKRIQTMPSVPAELIDELCSIMLSLKPGSESMAVSRQHVTERMNSLASKYEYDVFCEAVFLARRNILENN